MTDVNGTLRALGFEEVRTPDGEWNLLNGQLSDRTTDELDLILRPNDREGVAHVKENGDLVAIARK